MKDTEAKRLRADAELVKAMLKRALETPAS